MSYVSPAAVVAQQLSGVDFYRFLRDLLDNFDERKEDLVAKLQELQARIFTSTNTVTSFTGSDEDYRRYWEVGGNLGLTPRTAPAKELYVPMPEPRREAFIIPSDVCYVARSTDPRVLDIQMDGTWAVAAQAVTYEYLWNEIRRQGRRLRLRLPRMMDRQLAFYTYRDPAIEPLSGAHRAHRRVAQHLRATQDAFEGMVVSCASGFDAPIKPYALTKQPGQRVLCKRAQPTGALDCASSCSRQRPRICASLAKPSRA